MDAKLFYPVGIGKHIVCIDADIAATAHKQLVGGNPEPHTFSFRKEKVCQKKRNYH